MRHAITIVAALAALSGAALAQTAPAKPSPAKPEPAKPTPGPSGSVDEAMPDVDPAVLAQCRDSAAKKNLKGPARDQFIRGCIEPED